MKKLTFKQIRLLFWESHPQFKKDYRVKKSQNDYKTDIRVSFTDFMYHLYQNEQITEKQYSKITI
jgi:hypothetical protein